MTRMSIVQGRDLEESKHNVVLIRLAVTDNDDTLISDADRGITVSIKGQGCLVSMHNGDPWTDNYKSYLTPKALNGLLGGYLRSATQPGEMTASATANSLVAGMISLSIWGRELQHQLHNVVDEAKNERFGLNFQDT